MMPAATCLSGHDGVLGLRGSYRGDSELLGAADGHVPDWLTVRRQQRQQQPPTWCLSRRRPTRPPRSPTTSRATKPIGAIKRAIKAHPHPALPGHPRTYGSRLSLDPGKVCLLRDPLPRFRLSPNPASAGLSDHSLDTLRSMHPPRVQPPQARRSPVTTVHHGFVKVDEYDWLNDKTDPDVTAYLEAENAYTAARTEHLADLRGRLFEEVRSRTQETDLSVPSRSGDFWYYGRSFAGREYGASCRVPVADPADWTPPQPVEDGAPDEPALPGEEVLLDLNDLAEGHDYFALGGSSVSIDGALLAYATDTVGDERYVVRIKDLRTRALLDDELTNVMGGATWDRTGEHLYYSTVDDAWRPDKIWRHRLGTPQSEDELVYEEKDARFWAGIGRTRTDRFLVIVVGSKTTTEHRYLDLDDPGAGFAVFHPRQDGLEHHLEHAVISGKDVFLILHNGRSEDFEIAVAPIMPTVPEDWRPLIPHEPGVRFEDVSAFAGHLVVQQRRDGQTGVRVFELDDTGLGADHLIDFGREIQTVTAGGNPEFDQPVVRVGYTSLAVPASVYDYDVRDRSLTLRKQVLVLGEYDPAGYDEYRLWAPTPDGERIPISLVVRRGGQEAGPVPLLLYGYGSYEISIDPGFSIFRLSMLDRGAAFAIAHVRGGGEMGRHWYDDGKMLRKRNTFTDFVACARYLVDEGWTTAETMVAEGGSAGGLLMGAVANLAPDLFAGIVAEVPFVDTLTSMLDESLPLTVAEYEEWGNPTADPEVYEYLRGYAPYENVDAVDYPPILAETSLNDTRVLYVEPAKWIARLRATATGRKDFLLKTEMAAGHGGVSGRYQAWHDRAFALAWILDRMNLASDLGSTGPSSR
jgi:oligopeptidase B